MTWDGAVNIHHNRTKIYTCQMSDAHDLTVASQQVLGGPPVSHR